MKQTRLMKFITMMIVVLIFTSACNSSSEVGNKESLDNEKNQMKSTTDKNDVESSIFYEDNITIDKMGEKKILFANEAINETQTLTGVDVTFEGYQFTQFVPDEAYEPDFDIFDGGIVLFTTKFHFTNNNDEEIYINVMWDSITVNDGENEVGSPVIFIRTELDKERNILDPGESTIAYQVTALAEHRFEAIKDEELSIEFGPIYQLDSDGRVFAITGETISFDLLK